jgi:hypothetical protein
MFNLEKSIAEWRKQMLTAGIKFPVPLGELENHLREEIERQVRSGADSPRAFEIAAEKIGPASELKNEFKKVPEPLEIRFVKLAGIACGVVAGFFLLWTVFVFLFIREANWASRIFGLLAVVMTVLSWRYAGELLPAIRYQKIRAATGLLACAAGFGGTLLFIKQALPGLFEVPLYADFPINKLFDLFVIIWTAMAILGAVAYRLDEAAGKNGRQCV